MRFFFCLFFRLQTRAGKLVKNAKSGKKLLFHQCQGCCQCAAIISQQCSIYFNDLNLRQCKTPFQPGFASPDLFSIYDEDNRQKIFQMQKPSWVRTYLEPSTSSVVQNQDETIKPQNSSSLSLCLYRVLKGPFFQPCSQFSNSDIVITSFRSAPSP